jgi:hypothetical protein
VSERAHTKEGEGGVGSGSVAPHRGRRGEAWWGLVPAGEGDWRGRAAVDPAWQHARRQGMKGGSDQGGPRLGHCHLPAQVHSADFDLNKDFLN